MKNAFGHIGMGLLLMLVFGLAAFAVTRHPAASVWIAWAMQCAYWLGREVRDHQIHEAARGNDITYGLRSLLAFLIWRWNADGRKDLLAPVLANALVPTVTNQHPSCAQPELPGAPDQRRRQCLPSR